MVLNETFVITMLQIIIKDDHIKQISSQQRDATSEVLQQLIRPDIS